MTEQDRIQSIRQNGGEHLQRFKPENITYAMCIEAVKRTGTAIWYVPEQFKTEEVYAIACKKYGDILERMPQKYITHDICLDSVKSSGTALRFVPEEYIDEDICFAAVYRDPQALKLVPENILTPLFCARLLKEINFHRIKFLPESCKNTKFYSAIIDAVPEVFWYLPKKNRTSAICRQAIHGLGYSSTVEAVKANPKIFSYLHPSLYDHDSCLEFVKSDFLKSNTRIVPGMGMHASIICDELKIDENVIKLDKLLRFSDVCLEAVQTCGHLLEGIPRDLVTREICEKALISDGHSFRYVPDEFKTKEICEFAVQCLKWNIEEIPDQYKTPQMCLDAVKTSGFLLKAVPDNMKTYEMCVIAVSDDGTGLDYVPDSLFDKKMALLAIEHARNEWGLLNQIPGRLRDRDVCLAAVTRSGTNLEYVPDDIKDYDICLAAAQNSHRVAQYVPLEFFTPELCLALIKNGDFDKIPKDCLTTELCLEAVKKGSRYSGTVIGDVPRHLITQEMCDTAIKVSVHSLSRIPEEFITEDILMYVAGQAPGLLPDNFPARFRNEEFIGRMIEKYPSSEKYIRDRILNQLSIHHRE